MKKWKCLACDHVYDEEKGYPEKSIKPGTKFKDMPGEWVCPVCGVSKEYFRNKKNKTKPQR